MTNKTLHPSKIQIICLIILPFLWLGYSLAWYHHNEQNISYYNSLVLALSLLNANILFSPNQLFPKYLNILNIINCIIFLGWVLMTIIALILK